MKTEILKLSLFVLLVVDLNEPSLVNCKTDVHFWRRTEGIFTEALYLPTVAHGTITGNYLILPFKTRMQIEDFFAVCFSKKTSLRDVNALQFMIAEAILAWKRHHEIISLDAAMDNVIKIVHNQLKYRKPEEEDYLHVSYHYKIFQLFYEEKVFAAKPYFTSKNLDGAEKLEQINDVIQMLPIMCFWKISLLRFLLNGVNLATIRPVLEKEIIASISHYLRNENIADRDELELALRLSDTFYKVMSITERSFEFLKRNKQENPIEGVSLTKDQANELMQMVSQTIPLHLKSFTFPDILVETYSEIIGPKRLRSIQDAVLHRFMKAGLRHTLFSKDESLPVPLPFSMISNPSTSEEQSNTNSSESDTGGVSASMSSSSWLTPVSKISGSGTVIEPDRSAKSLSYLITKSDDRRLHIQPPIPLRKPRGAQVSSDPPWLQQSMQHLNL